MDTIEDTGLTAGVTFVENELPSDLFGLSSFHRGIVFRQSAASDVSEMFSVEVVRSERDAEPGRIVVPLCA